MKAIGVKMVDIMPMSVSMALEHGYRIGNKTTLMSLLTITGYECHGLSACVDANNYNQEIGEKFA